MSLPPLARDQEAAASGVVAFLVAGVIFMGSIGAVLMASRGSDDGTAAASAPAATLHAQAVSLADFLLDSPGFSSTGGDWTVGGVGAAGATPMADGLKRLGLKDDGPAGRADPTLLNFSKFRNLRMAPFAANHTDGYVNYEEARAGLGLGKAGLDFHIRASPTLKGVAEMLRTGYKDPNLRVAYIGDIEVSKSTNNGPPVSPTAGLVVTTPTCAISPLTASPAPQGYRLATTVTNGGLTTTQFTGLFTYKLGTAAPESQNANSYLVPPGATVTLSVDVPATSGRSCAVGSTITVAVTDPDTARVSNATTIATAVEGAATAPRDLWLDTGKPYRLNQHGLACQNKERSQATYFGADLAKNEWMAFGLVNATSGASVPIPAAAQSFKVPSSKGPWVLDLGCVPPGEYRGTLYYCGANPCSGSASTEQVTERLLVLASAPASYQPPGTTTSTTTYAPRAPAVTEIGFLNTLVGRFCPTYFDSGADVAAASPIGGTDWSLPANGVGSDDVWSGRCAAFKASQAQPGDVFPDSKKVMNEDLPARLLRDDGTPRYDLTSVLVVGSGVDQNAMTSGAAKFAVRDWVLGGGILIVFGSEDQTVNWLEPIFHAAIRSSSGPLSVPDPSHPVLHSADELDYPHYVHNNRVWNFNGQTAQQADRLFTNVVTSGGNPVTAESNAGAMGKGTVLLTTWMPYDLFAGGRDAETARAEGLKLVNNLLVQGYRDLFLDYGPPLPGETNVEPAVRRMQVCHPDFVPAHGTCEPIQLSIAVYVFKSP